MTQKELKQHLLSLRIGASQTAREQEDGMIDWILEALRRTSYTFDIEKYEKDVPRKDRHLVDVLTMVAYSLPNLPQSFRRKKWYLFNQDAKEFFDMEDEGWEEYRKKNFAPIVKIGYVKIVKH